MEEKKTVMVKINLSIFTYLNISAAVEKLIRMKEITLNNLLEIITQVFRVPRMSNRG